MYNDINQGLKKIGPPYSEIHDKQARVVEMIKKYEVRPELKVRVN